MTFLEKSYSTQDQNHSAPKSCPKNVALTTRLIHGSGEDELAVRPHSPARHWPPKTGHGRLDAPPGTPWESWSLPGDGADRGRPVGVAEGYRENPVRPSWAAKLHEENWSKKNKIPTENWGEKMRKKNSKNSKIQRIENRDEKWKLES